LPNVGPYIYDVSISGFTRSSIYIYDISSLRVKELIVLHLFKSTLAVLEPKGSLTCSQKRITFPCLEPVESEATL